MDLKSTLTEFISSRQKVSKVYYVGKSYTTSRWDDSTYFKVRVKLGLRSLVLDILGTVPVEVLEEYMARYRKRNSIIPFVRELSDRVMKGKEKPKVVEITPNIKFITKFDKHFGEGTHRLIRELLKFYSNLNYNRFNKTQLINNLDGKEVDLRDHDVQLRIYKKIFDEFNDPLVLRLALTPQYHFRYQSVNFNGFFELLRSIYTRIYTPRPKGAQYGILDKAVYKEVIDRLSNSTSVNKIMHFIKYAASYSLWLSKTKGIDLVVDKSQFLIGDKFNLGVCFLEQSKMFDAFPIEDFREMLSCGYFYNPWEYLHNIFLGSSPKSIGYLLEFRNNKYKFQLDRLDGKKPPKYKKEEVVIKPPSENDIIAKRIKEREKEVENACKKFPYRIQNKKGRY